MEAISIKIFIKRQKKLCFDFLKYFFNKNIISSIHNTSFYSDKLQHSRTRIQFNSWLDFSLITCQSPKTFLFVLDFLSRLRMKNPDHLVILWFSKGIWLNRTFLALKKFQFRDKIYVLWGVLEALIITSDIL